MQISMLGSSRSTAKVASFAHLHGPGRDSGGFRNATAKGKRIGQAWVAVDVARITKLTHYLCYSDFASWRGRITTPL
jgi:hypothetical protein